MPRTRKVPPCVRTLIFRSPHVHLHARTWNIKALAGIAVEDKTIDASAEGFIDQRLHDCRMPLPTLRTRRGQCFSGNDVRAVEMGGRSHQLDRRVEVGMPSYRNPEFGHRNVDILHGIHVVGRRGVAFVGELKTFFIGQIVHFLDIVFYEKLTYGKAQVVEKTLRFLQRTNNAPCERRKPRTDVIAPLLAEYLFEAWSPILPSSFPTVNVDDVERRITGTLLEFAHHLVEMVTCGFTAEFVGLRTYDLVDDRTYAASCPLVAETYDGPLPFRYIPREVSAAVHLVGKHDYLISWNNGR